MRLSFFSNFLKLGAVVYSTSFSSLDGSFTNFPKISIFLCRFGLIYGKPPALLSP
jgi:hypothetical protein